MTRTELKAAGKACAYDDCLFVRRFGDIYCEEHAAADRQAVRGVLEAERAVIVHHIEQRAYALRQKGALDSDTAAELDLLIIWIRGRDERAKVLR